MRHKNQRVGIFVDVQNLYHSAKHLYQARVNFSQLIKFLVDGRQLIRAIAYVVKSDPLIGEAFRLKDKRVISKSPEASFFEALEKSGMDLRVKDLQIFPGGVKKADWDVGLAVDAIRMASFLDVVILVTGDGDFVPLVDYLKWGLGRQVEVASFGRSTSAKLKEAADLYIDLDDNPKILLGKRE
ncbi:MAG: NYN domain-containing protein [Candidatus Parcubacteria bacterium]|nr:NYN domain-containing protein [Patescibacteria group bacterium]BCX15868.1 MAG: NYN domain-containing protein [Candidatus Parcubacteria bacterium]